MTLRCQKCGHDWTDESRTNCPHCDSTDVRKLVYEAPVKEEEKEESDPKTDPKTEPKPKTESKPKNSED